MALLAAAEGALRLAGFEAKIARGRDPTANLLPLFHRASAPDGTPVLKRIDAPVSFRQEKPANGLRIFVLGESSVFGAPFGPDLSFPRFLGDRLTAALRDRTVEVVNCGISGIGSWHARRIFEEEVVRYQPDIVALYLGHNDWCVPPPVPESKLEEAMSRSRLYQIAAVASARWRRWWYGPLDEARLRATNDAFGYARQRARGELNLSRAIETDLTSRFADNLSAIVRSAQRAGAQVVLATIAQNLRDFPPGGSRHRCGLPPAARAQWTALANEANRDMQSGDCVEALEALRQARRIDARPAIAHYLRGRCLDELGRFGSARVAYRLASDLDEVPMGARSSTNAIIRRIAAESRAQLVDVATAFAHDSLHGLVGRELVFDHVHPTVAGHITIARELSRALGVSDGDGYEWPDPDALIAKRPDARQVLGAATVPAYLMLGRYDAALQAVSTAQWSPDQEVTWRAKIELIRDNDQVRSWTDLPEGAD